MSRQPHHLTCTRWKKRYRGCSWNQPRKRLKILVCTFECCSTILHVLFVGLLYVAVLGHTDSYLFTRYHQLTPLTVLLIEPWLVKEIHAFYRGRRRLAEMMGRDPETFTDKDVEVGAINRVTYTFWYVTMQSECYSVDLVVVGSVLCCSMLAGGDPVPPPDAAECEGR